jgi:hypothetical protein
MEDKMTLERKLNPGNRLYIVMNDGEGEEQKRV